MAVVAPVEQQLGLLTASPAGFFLIPSWHQNWLKPHCSWDTLLESSCSNTWCQYVEEKQKKTEIVGVEKQEGSPYNEHCVSLLLCCCCTCSRTEAQYAY